MIRSTLLRSLGAAFVAAFAALPVGAQDMSLPASGLAQQSLRPYWHVFIAYSIVIVLVLGWVVSISRRLKDVEKRLED